MAKQRDYFSLGLWVIAVTVLFVAALIFIGGRQWGQRYQAYVVRYPATFALPDEIKTGAQVYCGSAEVGRVTGVALRRGSNDDGASRLWAYLDVHVQPVVELRSDCSIVARGSLLGGGGRLIITDPGRNGTVLAEGAVIDGSPAGTMEAALDALNAEIDPENPAGLLASIKDQLDPADVGSIMGKVHASLNHLNTMTERLAGQLAPQQRETLLGKLHQVLDNVNDTTRQLRDQVAVADDTALLAKVHAALDALNVGLASATEMLDENRPVVRDSLLSVQRTADTLEHGIAEPIAAELNRANTQSLLAQLHQSFAEVNAALADVHVVSDRARSVVVLNEGRLNSLITNLSETAAHLKSAGKDLRRNPWRLFYRPTEDESKQLNIFDAAREFSEASARLDNSAAKLTALMEAHGGRIPGDDPNLAAIRQRLQETFDDYTRAEEALWKQLDIR
ncbi:MAG: hypothetical protein GY778_30990 [bacterium]|nr:hypothetical protein [bacterium]